MLNTTTHIATRFPASPEAVQQVLAADRTDKDHGRSPFMWIRLANGDLILGVYPHGDTYEAMEPVVEGDWRKAYHNNQHENVWAEDLETLA